MFLYNQKFLFLFWLSAQKMGNCINQVSHPIQPIATLKAIKDDKLSNYEINRINTCQYIIKEYEIKKNIAYLKGSKVHNVLMSCSTSFKSMVLLMWFVKHCFERYLWKELIDLS